MPVATEVSAVHPAEFIVSAVLLEAATAATSRFPCVGAAANVTEGTPFPPLAEFDWANATAISYRPYSETVSVGVIVSDADASTGGLGIAVSNSIRPPVAGPELKIASFEIVLAVASGFVKSLVSV